MSDFQWVLVLGAGYWQIPLIETVQRLGFRVLAIDMDPEAPGKKIADHFEPVNIIDSDSAIELGRKFKIAGAVSDQTDLAVPPLAKICKALDLPGPSIETAHNTTNKGRMRELAKVAKVKNPKYRVCNTIDDGINAITENHHDAPDGVGFPCVVKPTDSQASRGVQKVESMELLPEACAEALKYSRESKFLVESYIHGTEVTVEGCRYNKETHLLCISRKRHTPPPHIIAMNLDFPAGFSDSITSEIERTYFALVDALGIQAGSIHGELIVSDDGVYLVEMANRGGGSGTSSHCVPAYTGVDLLEANVLYATGNERPVIRQRNRAGVLRFMLYTPGEVIGISGLEGAQKIPGVVKTDLYIKMGDILRPPVMDTMRHGYIITVADTLGDAQRIADEVEKTILVTTKKQI